MRLLQFLIAIHVVGLFVFNLFGLLGVSYWETIYFLWDKSVGAGFLIFFALLKAVKPEYRWIIRPVLVLSLVRFIWQFIVHFTKWDVNNQWWLAGFFVCLSGMAGWLIFHPKNRVNIFLSKHL
jgi:hypothetical protein